MKLLDCILAACAGMVVWATAFADSDAAGADNTYVPQPVIYSTSNVDGNRQAFPLGDHSNAHGGTAPAYFRQAPAIATPEPIEGWYTTGSAPRFDGNEAKFRTHCNHSHLAYDDPILFPGQPGKSHLHMFFGNTKTNAYSTFESLRTTGGGTCAGGILNRTAYWFPAVLKDNAIGDGKTMAVQPDYMVIYYSIGASAVSLGTAIPNGFNYITGFDPADPTGSITDAEIAASPTGGFAKQPIGQNGFIGWHCEGVNGPNKTAAVPGDFQPYLRNGNGTPTLDCAPGTRIYATVNAAACWDGVNLGSPTGRGHVRDFVRDPNVGNIQVCPVGWYRLPRLAITFWFSHLGSADYTEWYLSSDRHHGARFRNGESWHTDWFGAWDPDFFKAWQLDCTGVFMPGETSNPHTCSDSQVGDGRKLITAQAAPDGSKAAQLDTGTRWTEHGNARFLPIPGD